MPPLTFEVFYAEPTPRRAMQVPLPGMFVDLAVKIRELEERIAKLEQDAAVNPKPRPVGD